MAKKATMLFLCKTFTLIPIFNNILAYTPFIPLGKGELKGVRQNTSEVEDRK